LDDLKLKNSKDAKDHLISYLSKEELAFEYGDGSQDPVIEEDPNFQISHLMPEEDDMDEDEEGLPIDYACPETTRGEEGGVKKTGCGEMQQV
jgi:hypothetical protein